MHDDPRYRLIRAPIPQIGILNAEEVDLFRTVGKRHLVRERDGKVAIAVVRVGPVSLGVCLLWVLMLLMLILMGVLRLRSPIMRVCMGMRVRISVL
jgi:hypothetical protein